MSTKHHVTRLMLVAFMLPACPGCGNLGAALRVASELGNRKPGAPDQLIYRPGPIEPVVVGNVLWLEICDPDGVKSVEVTQGSQTIKSGGSARGYVPGYLNMPRTMHQFRRFEGLVDGAFKVTLRDPDGVATEQVFEKDGAVVRPLGPAESTKSLIRTSPLGTPIMAPDGSV